MNVPRRTPLCIRQHHKFLPLLMDIESGKTAFAGRRIVICDPNDPWHRNVYEDIGGEDDGLVEAPAQAKLTMEPGHTRDLMDGGDGADFEVILTHGAAVADAVRMVLRHGFVIVEIAREQRLDLAPS